MNEVSCRSLAAPLRAARLRGMSDSDLLAGVPYPIEHLKNGARHIDWSAFCALHRNLARVFTPEQLVNLGGDALRSPGLRPLTLVARLLFSSRDFYLWAYGPSSPVTGMFTCVRTELVERRPGALVITLEIAEGHEVNEEFFHVSQGVMVELPRIVGLPSAKATLTRTGNRGVYEVEYPVKGGAFSFLWRALAWPFRVVRAGRELKSANEDLRKRYFEVQDARDNLEKKVVERTDQLALSLQQVKEADRLKTEFFANASHELRTPLTLMLAPLEVLVASNALGPEAKADLTGVARSGYKLLKLVNDLLDLSKIEAGKMTLTMGAVDLVTLLGEVLRPWGAPLKTRNITLTSLLEGVLPLAADAERLEQVALNLVSNAIKFTPDGGRIDVKAGRNERGVFFSIQNSGEGIPAAELPTLFGRFTQSTRSKTRRFGSTGLGLPVVRELVELHGGTIEAESKEGQWVRFTVQLPEGKIAQHASPQDLHPAAAELRLFDAAAHRENSSAASPLALAADDGLDLPTIVVAEDNEALRAFVVKNLASTFRVIEAGDGAQALRLIRQHLPDVVLSDLMMPELDGLELCAELKSDPTLANIPFVLLTARADIDTRLTGFEKGADDYLLKPFHLEELRARLNAQLRLRKLATQMAQREKLASLGSVVAGVAHEIRNPLNGIINALEPLKELLPSASPELIELIDLAIESSKRVEYVSDQLLKQGRAGEGTRGDVDLTENVRLAMQLLSHKLNEGVALTAELGSNDVVNVIGEAGALHQVWVNLIDNAIQAASPSGAVKVKVSRSNGHATVEVSDNGKGIEPRILKRIFDPFFTTRAVGGGTGLGLAIVREIVEKHGGQISVDSVLGQGSRFTVKLPNGNPLPGASHVTH